VTNVLRRNYRYIEAEKFRQQEIIEREMRRRNKNKTKQENARPMMLLLRRQQMWLVVGVR
jgi:hypothetical protein